MGEWGGVAVCVGIGMNGEVAEDDGEGCDDEEVDDDDGVDYGE